MITFLICLSAWTVFECRIECRAYFTYKKTETGVNLKLRYNVLVFSFCTSVTFLGTSCTEYMDINVYMDMVYKKRNR